MNVAPESPSEVVTTDSASAADAEASAVRVWLVPRLLAWALVGLVAAALLIAGLLWQKLGLIQEQLARQSADSTAVSVEARAMAKQAQELARETAAKHAVMDARLSEVALQRTQLDELMKSLSRSRDENLVVDIESAIQLAQQQSQLTGSLEPLLAALRTADQRVARAAQPRLNPLQRAMARDVDRIKAATVADTPSLLVKLDELVRMTDELPVANAVGATSPGPATKSSAPSKSLTWWQSTLATLEDEVRRLVRVSRIEQPEASLLSPEQSFFLRENLKLKLLNARLGLLARQTDSARADLGAAIHVINKYFDPASRKTQAAMNVALQVQSQMRNLELPRLDGTLAALATAAAGR